MINLGVLIAMEVRGNFMKKQADRVKAPDMLAEYDFSAGVRGKYAERFAHVRNDAVVLEPDIAELFHDSKSVNEALRVIVKLAGKQAHKTRTVQAAGH